MIRALLAAALLIVALGAGRAASAEVDARMIEVGANLVEAERSMPGLAGQRVLMLNGARVVMLSGSSPQPVAAVLDHFQRHCGSAEGPGRFLRADDDRRGYVACLARLAAAASTSDLVSVLRDVAVDGLAAAGGVRYFYAERRGDATL